MTRNLLICVDAFGTLFRPRQPIFKQYGDVARAHGMKSAFTDDQIANAFKNAFKDESKAHPNYGKAVNMGSYMWWTNVIEKTFKALISTEDLGLLPVVTPALIDRFNSKEGYEVFPDAFDFLRDLAKLRHKRQRPEVIVGLITNSDDRVPDVLSSFGLRLEKRRLDQKSAEPSNVLCPDIDFVTLSYDVGHEKPSRHIFNQATSMASEISCQGSVDSQWHRLYIGDELEKDAFGAIDAGWDAVLVDRENQYQTAVSKPAGKDDWVASLPVTVAKGRRVPVVPSFAPLRDIIGL